MRMRGVGTCGHVLCGRVELGEDPGEEQAVVLCSLSFTAGGILTVSPDFSWSGRPYRLEVGACSSELVGELSATCPQVGGREVLEWSVEHVSRDMEAASLVREAALQHEVSL